MIVLKIPVAQGNMDFKPFITEISSILFNSEQGIHVFDDKGNILEGELYGTKFNTIKKDGVSYNIVGNVGNIILATNFSKGFMENFKIDLYKELEKLDNKYYKINTNLKCRKFNSTDYFSTVYNVNTHYNRKNNNNREIVLLRNSRPSMNFGYMWKLVSWDYILFREDKIWKNRNHNEFDLLQKHNTLIIDYSDVFNYTERFTFLTEDPTVKDYKMSEKFISMEAVLVSKTGVPIKAELYNGILCGRDYNHDYSNYTDSNIKFPIYYEEWGNIKPVRIQKKDNILDDDDLVKLLTDFHKDQGQHLTEGEELKNIKHGAPPTYNDICNICSMYLYEEIYVLEKNNRDFHVCVCCDCLHKIVIRCDFDVDYLFNDITILRVKHPRTAKDLILHKDHKIDDGMKQLLIELLEGFTTADDDILMKTNRFIGYSEDEVSSVLIKQISPHKEKKLFVFKFI